MNIEIFPQEVVAIGANWNANYKYVLEIILPWSNYTVMLSIKNYEKRDTSTYCMRILHFKIVFNSQNESCVHIGY